MFTRLMFRAHFRCLRWGVLWGGKICCFHVVVLPLIGSRVHAFDVQSPLQVSQTGVSWGGGKICCFHVVVLPLIGSCVHVFDVQDFRL